MKDIQVKPWVVTAGKVIIISAVAAFIYVVASGFDQRVTALEQRPLAIQPLPTAVPSIAPSATPSATTVIAPVRKSVAPSATVR